VKLAHHGEVWGAHLILKDGKDRLHVEGLHFEGIIAALFGAGEHALVRRVLEAEVGVVVQLLSASTELVHIERWRLELDEVGGNLRLASRCLEAVAAERVTAALVFLKDRRVWREEIRHRTDLVQRVLERGLT